MPTIYAAITVLLCVLVLVAMRRDIWPPKTFGWRERIITWGVTIIAIGCAYLAGTSSFNAWGWPDWIRWYVGFSICFVVSSFSSLAIVQMGLDQAMGANRALKTDGLFARSRNPTYIANITLCAGFVLLAASTPALVAAGALAVLYITAVPHEERWLLQTYGQAYSDYQKRVKRWF